MKTIAAIFVIVVVMLASCDVDYRPSQKDYALATAKAIETAVNNFYAEYGYLPTTLTNDTEINTKDNTDFLNIILGLESTSGTQLNKRQIKFLMVKEGKNNKDGLIYNSASTAVTGLYDPWGGPYRVMLDADNDEHLKVNGKALYNRRVAVWSDGPDRIAGTKDDIKTW